MVSLVDTVLDQLAALDPWRAAFAVACVFGAAIVRGYSGFGFSLLAVTSLSLVFRPAEIIPAIFLLEIVASFHLLPGLWRDIDWRSIGILLVGCVVATPFGVFLLSRAPAELLQLGLSVFVLIAVILMWRGFALRRVPGPAATLATGAASGLANGAIGIGGPPVILFYFGSPAGAAVSRASIVAYFLGTDLIGLVFQAREGLVTAQTIILAGLFLPALVAGVWLGARSFKTTNPAAFRRWILILLTVMAVIVGAKALAGL